METSTSFRWELDSRTGLVHADPRSADRSATRRGAAGYRDVSIASAFAGWFVSISAIVLLTALAAAVASLVIAPIGAIDQSAGAVQRSWVPGLWGTVVLVANAFIGCYCGGYVAGRLSRCSAVQHGVAVWASVTVTGMVVAVVVLAAGEGASLLTSAVPVLPVPEAQTSVAAVLSVVAAASVALAGAMLGALGGGARNRPSRVSAATIEAPAAGLRPTP